MDQSIALVKEKDIKAYLEVLVQNEQEIVNDLGEIIPFVKNKELRSSLVRRQTQGLEGLVALRAGYIPVNGGWFTKTDTKSRWGKKDVEDSLSTMPSDVKELWEKVRDKGIFDSFSVTTRRSGDPLLVGNLGRKHYFIAGWLPLSKSISIGIKIRLPV